MYYGALMSYHITSYHLFYFHKSTQDYKIHVDMKTVTFLEVEK